MFSVPPCHGSEIGVRSYMEYLQHKDVTSMSSNSLYEERKIKQREQKVSLAGKVGGVIVYKKFRYFWGVLSLTIDI